MQTNEIILSESVYLSWCIYVIAPIKKAKMKGTHKIVIGKYEDRRSPRTKKNEKRKKKYPQNHKIKESWRNSYTNNCGEILRK